MTTRNTITVISLLTLLAAPLAAQVAIKGGRVHTVSGDVIENGVVVITDGRIVAVGPADGVSIPAGHRVLEGAVVTPGLIDAHATVGLTGIYNQKQDQDQLESSEPIQPQLQATDAYNAREQLVDWIRSFGVTTVHTGHAPGELVSGQTAILKTRSGTVEDATVVGTAAIAVTLAESARKEGGKSPGNRSKMMAMLREALVAARDYVGKQERAGDDADKRPGLNLKNEALAGVLRGETPLLITANRAIDIASALRLAKEFEVRLWLDGAAEAYLLIDEIKAAGVPVIVHPLMQRPWGEAENLSYETPAKLRAAGIPIALQSGFEGYVPKVRVVLFEAAIAAANGLGMEGALRAITLDAATLLGIEERVGSLEVGKDGDVAIYDGDPFEYTSHCVGVVIDGQVVFEGSR